MPESFSTKPLSTKPLSSWREGASRDNIIGFVEQTCGEVTARAVPVEERVAVFDNDYLDDGKEKPVRIWGRTGRRPVFAAGNSNGDIPMLDFTQHDDKPFLRLLVLHDDAEREYSYISGAEQALERAAKVGWTVVSIKNDWTTVFNRAG